MLRGTHCQCNGQNWRCTAASEEKGGKESAQTQTQIQIQEQAKRRPSAGVVRTLHHSITRLQSTLLGLAAGVAFKLCPFGGGHPFIGWLSWAVGFHQHRPSPARSGPVWPEPSLSAAPAFPALPG